MAGDSAVYGNRPPIRGQSYGGNHNTTIPTAAQVAASLGVRPPADVSPQVWQRAYRTLQYAIPLLHAVTLFDPVQPRCDTTTTQLFDSSLNVYCMYWKALSGNDRTSPVYDEGLASTLLPTAVSRWVVQYPHYYPRLHHANVELRTAYLDQSVEYFAAANRQTKNMTPLSSFHRHRKIRLVSFGAGYDVRSIKLKLRHIIDQAVELDLPQVIDSKRRLFTSHRFRHKVQALGGGSNIDNETTSIQPHMIPVDLNDLERVRMALEEVFRQQDGDDDEQQHASSSYHTIFLFEAVMIYLNEGIPRALLQLCRSMLEKQHEHQEEDKDNHHMSSS
jgi:Leucine carboxyl methyltransferase